jgi:hypothetical protein
MRLFIALIVVVLVAAPLLAQETPTPLPTATAFPLPEAEMYQQLATQNALIATLPADIQRPAGANVVPQVTDYRFVAYARWLLSPAAADEWAGPFAATFSHIGVGMYMVFTLMVVYGTVYAIGHAGGWLGWLWAMIHRIFDGILQMLQAGPMLLVLVVILLIAGVLFSQEAVQRWVAEQFAAAVTWVNNATSQALNQSR